MLKPLVCSQLLRDRRSSSRKSHRQNVVASAALAVDEVILCLTVCNTLKYTEQSGG